MFSGTIVSRKQDRKLGLMKILDNLAIDSELTRQLHIDSPNRILSWMQPRLKFNKLFLA